jgi:hypothetical protein
MIKDGEVFVQVPQKMMLAPSSAAIPVPQTTAAPAAKPAAAPR